MRHVRRELGALIVGAVVLGAGVIAAQQPTGPAQNAAIPPGLPDWAYTPPPPAGGPPPPSALPADDAAVVSIPGTDKTFTRGQLREKKETMDWHPEDRWGWGPANLRRIQASRSDNASSVDSSASFIPPLVFVPRRRVQS